MNQAEFVSRFLHQVHDDWTYSPPTAEALQDALSACKDELGFADYEAQFLELGEIMDAQAAIGLWGGDPRKDARVLAIADREPARRAAMVAAAAQTLAWLDQCQNRVRNNTPRNQIGMKVATSVLLVAGKAKGGFTPAQLAALVRIGASSQDMDGMIIMGRGMIAVILAGHSEEIPADPATRRALKEFLDFINAYPAKTQKEIKAIAKLLPIAAG